MTNNGNTEMGYELMTNGIGGFKNGQKSSQYGGLGSMTETRTAYSVKWTNRTNSQKNKIQKKLNYNPREISSQLLRASKTTSAAEILARAKTKLGVLRRSQGTGQYDSDELRIAITHAQKMVRCAQLKVRNLKEEEQTGIKNERKNSCKRQQKKVMEAVELRQKRCRHRSRERAKINLANMEYIDEKRRYDSRSDNNNSTGVTLELSSTAMQLKELQMAAAALTPAEEQQLEEEIEQQIEMELQMQEAGITTDSAFFQGTEVPTGADAVPAGTIDVVI